MGHLLFQCRMEGQNRYLCHMDYANDFKPSLGVPRDVFGSWQYFRTPRGARGASKRRAMGASFLRICILGIFGNISSHLSLDRCQKHPKKILERFWHLSQLKFEELSPKIPRMQILRKLAPLAPLLLAPLSPLGVPKYFQDPKSSLGTSRDGLKPV